MEQAGSARGNQGAAGIFVFQPGSLIDLRLLRLGEP